MDAVNHLLACLAEEGCEIGQRATKAQRFGIAERQPGQPLTNRERLIGEINDLLGVVELLHEFGVGMRGVGDRAAITAKKKKLRYFMAYANELGTLEL